RDTRPGHPVLMEQIDHHATQSNRIHTDSNPDAEASNISSAPPFVWAKRRFSGTPPLLLQRFADALPPLSQNEASQLGFSDVLGRILSRISRSASGSR
ncbi:hypothetical protein, partial [Bifidobacterium simiarum]|uniref:hypothetical protein n=1 Tax=Bifidobacterium simiarum TaxID=2045441 RepID=UPI001BDC0DF2